MAGHTYDPPEGSIGYKRLLAPSRQAYATADGHVCTVLYTSKHWRSFFRLVGAEERYAADPRMATIAARTHHISALYAEVAGYLRTRPTAYWIEELTRLDIPVMPLHTLESLMHDPPSCRGGLLQKDAPSHRRSHGGDGGVGQLVAHAPLGDATCAAVGRAHR